MELMKSTSIPWDSTIDAVFNKVRATFIRLLFYFVTYHLCLGHRVRLL